MDNEGAPAALFQIIGEADTTIVNCQFSIVNSDKVTAGYHASRDNSKKNP